MFDRLKKALGLKPENAPANASRSSLLQSRVSEWASLQGYTLQEGNSEARSRASEHFTLSGRVGSKTWRLESGRPSRSFISGLELRARAELGLPEELAVMVMNRGLKELLEKNAFAAYTDSLQTVQDAQLGEELRWITSYEELRSPQWEPAFVQHLAVLADQPAPALRWLDATLMHDLLHWPSDLVTPHTPLVLQITRGKLYLRLQYTSGDIPTLEHAVRVLVWASESALTAFSGKK
jgi:hypothetical protein